MLNNLSARKGIKIKLLVIDFSSYMESITHMHKTEPANTGASGC